MKNIVVKFFTLIVLNTNKDFGNNSRMIYVNSQLKLKLFEFKITEDFTNNFYHYQL